MLIILPAHAKGLVAAYIVILLGAIIFQKRMKEVLI
jgi:hypothetical protein